MIRFSGYDWIVKSGEGKAGPGPNYFSSQSSNVWVDEQGRLHLKITRNGDQWRCAEVLTEQPLGYGAYIFKVEGRLDQLDRNIVFGMFTWDSDPIESHRELDIEVSKWGKRTGNSRLSFAVQPFSAQKGSWVQEGSYSMHIIKWKPDSVGFASYHGHIASPGALNSGCTEPDRISEGNDTRAHINLWLFNGKAPSDNKEQEVIIKSFEFIPYK